VKVYTRVGDAGDTALFGGQRTRKSDTRVAAYGAVDEANAFIGAAVAAGLGGRRRELLLGVMSDLFDVGAELATPAEEGAEAKLEARLQSRVDEARVAELESAIDDAEAGLPALKTFVLPTGTDAAARLHVARAQVRRAEREVIAFVDATGAPVRPAVLAYLNRLSDLLFVLAREDNHREGAGDVAWQAKKEA
jgi:cob(I)alamin adenosyltransferase